MRHHHDDDSGRDSVISAWAQEVRSGLVDEIGPSRIAGIAAVAEAAVVASTTVASATGAAVSQGGITMSISQAITSSGGFKLAAGGLAGALALGGGAMATGHLSSETTGPTEVEGNLLVETGLDGHAQAQVETRTIEVEGLGSVDVAHSDVDVEILGVQPEDGLSAEIRTHSQGVAEVDFIFDGAVRTLLVSVVDGELFASIAPTVSTEASVTVDAAIEADADANADAASGIEIDAEAGSSGTLDVDSENDLLTGVDAAGDIDVLGGFGIDAGIGN